jgi:preprotein translocase subunit SecA
MTKIREGVSLRSLEQKSPLNIYIEESDNNFEALKLAVARNTIYAIHKFFVANATLTLQKTLAKTNPGILTRDVLNSLMSQTVVKEINRNSSVSNVTTVVSDITNAPKSPTSDITIADNKERPFMGIPRPTNPQPKPTTTPIVNKPTDLPKK